MSNLSTPRHKVATIKSMAFALIGNQKPTPELLRDAVETVVDMQYKKGRPISFHKDGRAYGPYQRMTSPQKKIGKGNGKRV